jgi:uncharacterized membrane protein HdeD (DUF308 family)
MTNLFELLVLRPNRWYDNLPSIRRFIIFICSLITLVTGSTVLFGPTWGNVVFYGCFGLPFIVWRIAYFHYNHK